MFPWGQGPRQALTTGRLALVSKEDVMIFMFVVTVWLGSVQLVYVEAGQWPTEQLCAQATQPIKQFMNVQQYPLLRVSVQCQLKAESAPR
jgi:hypothetical protein